MSVILDVINKTSIPWEMINDIIDYSGPEDLGEFVILVTDSDKDMAGGSDWRGDEFRINHYSIPFIRIETNPDLEYPFEIKGVENEGYRRYTVLDRNELVMYLIAHELRHLWRARREDVIDRKAAETDSDDYAIKTIEEWRKMRGNST